MASAEEELNNLAMQAQIIRQRGETLQSQLDMMQRTITDLNATIDTLKNIKKTKGQNLLPIGSGTYLSCEKIDHEKVLVSVGAGVIVPKKAEEAVKTLEARLKTVTEAFNRGKEDFEQINKTLQQLNNRAAELSAERENVRPS